MRAVSVRANPLTEITNKHLLPVGREPMIWHPVRQLVGAENHRHHDRNVDPPHGIDRELVGSGQRFGCQFTYRVQDEAGVIPHALALSRGFAAGDPIVVMLGDNIFEHSIAPFVDDFRIQEGGARVMLKEVGDPERYGVAALDEETDTRDRGEAQCPEEQPRGGGVLRV